MIFILYTANHQHNISQNVWWHATPWIVHFLPIPLHFLSLSSSLLHDIPPIAYMYNLNFLSWTFLKISPTFVVPIIPHILSHFLTTRIHCSILIGATSNLFPLPLQRMSTTYSHILILPLSLRTFPLLSRSLLCHTALFHCAVIERVKRSCLYDYLYCEIYYIYIEYI